MFRHYQIEELPYHWKITIKFRRPGVKETCIYQLPKGDFPSKNMVKQFAKEKLKELRQKY